MEKIVIYKSKTGFTKQYAEWIAEEIGCKAVDLKSVTTDLLKQYNIIIYGGGITAGQIGGLKKFKTTMATFADKKFIVFATGATPVEVILKNDEFINANLTGEEKQKIPFFYCQSGINYEKMSFGGRLLMKMFSSMLAHSKNKTPEQEGMAQTISKSSDYSDKNFIEPLVNYVRSEEK
jgi:menaquinone-dependent protoporphyrinogen IX oxidase